LNYKPDIDKQNNSLVENSKNTFSVIIRKWKNSFNFKKYSFKNGYKPNMDKLE